ncbi:MAG: betaine/proline/choline family ABC transporter ATP-binding protein [Actinobacteria bacterium]|jgi:glycine betaine/proline transport system ATP-binding protein|nr:betaine/proline/choline family ABC transporter ATP-binding protein [Actinomycetota bacterium]MBT3745928.1 betaine/proline/choline family ABC transporter ATP-binding protein [Actinomycetota bacterium]MBT4009766.1 betaine/proline/choline family ABC transporter ATP-binding protein [Actinomycetota bacterium]MBT4656116.1 betaine/proline/choline family ABC transporter ATP-binding protein [Actinomycetota bacterium]MBT5085172.1 betaine/proline/choline family ABC transporter ATP-binding protein [Acti
MIEAGETIISLKNVFKIFGPDPRGRAFDLSNAGVHKDEVQRLSGHVVGMSDISFDVKRGEIFVVMGLSGSGKSTAIRTVNKLHDITSGSVTVDGVDVQALRGKELQEFRRETMGMVFQHFALFPHINVIQNTSYGLKVQGVERRERESAALKALDMVGLEAYANNKISELSGGMQQRVGLARALCSDPPILLMDEAFSALDPLIRRQMQDELMIIQKQLKKTILFITHDLNEALRLGTRVCILRDGKVVQIGTPEEILTEPANGYVAEFVQDVDQGRVIAVDEVMQDAVVVTASNTLVEAVDALGSRGGGFVVDANGCPTSLLTKADAGVALAHGSTTLGDVLRSDFETTLSTQRLNENYAAAGRGLPIAVVNDAGCLIGELEPREIMEEMGRVEQLIDGFEREVFL